MRCSAISLNSKGSIQSKNVPFFGSLKKKVPDTFSVPVFDPPLPPRLCLLTLGNVKGVRNLFLGKTGKTKGEKHKGSPGGEKGVSGEKGVRMFYVLIHPDTFFSFDQTSKGQIPKNDKAKETVPRQTLGKHSSYSLS